MSHVSPRAFAFLPVAFALISAACADDTRSVPTAAVAEAATLVGKRPAALYGNLDITGISIETRYWNPANGLPTESSAAATYNGLPTGTDGYTYPAVSIPNVGSAPSVLITPDGVVQATPVRHLGTANTNIATRIVITLDVKSQSSIGIRFGVDALGAVVLVDGDPRVWNWGTDSLAGEPLYDPSWYGYFLADVSVHGKPVYVSNPWGVLEILQLDLPVGVHTIEVIGFEDGGDFGTGGQIDLGAGYQDIIGPIPQQNLTVSKIGGGDGAVASSPTGISCGADCAQAYDFGTAVTLTAAATLPSVFAGWSGACSGMSTACTLSMNVDRAVTAKFVNVPTVTAMTMETRYWNQLGEQPTTATAWALFEGLPQDRAGYTNEPVPVSGFSNNAPLFTAPNVAAYRDIATRTVLHVNATAAVNLRIVADLDYQAGAGIWLDDVLDTAVFRGLEPKAYLTLEATMSLTPGAHTITIVGFEDCCDGGARMQMDFGAGLVDVAAPMPPPQRLTVTAGAAGGRILSAPAGIDCGVVCAADFAAGSQVTLSAAVNPGYVFTGWSGGGCSGTGTCVVRMNSARYVTANFTPQYKLTVVHAGTGAGSVVSSPAGITCGADCDSDYLLGEVVTLTATPDATSDLGAWSVPTCSGSTCTVTMQGAQTVTISFVRRMHALTVSKSGTGSGTVTSAPSGINCGADCSEGFAEGLSVVLTAVPATGSDFTGWTGACAGTAPTCTVPMNAAKTATANFTVRAFELSVSKAGAGSGVVSAPSAGINCGTSCASTLNYGTTVTLTATASTGSFFAGWSGACSGTGPCTVTMSQARAVTATFRLDSDDTTPPVISCKATPNVLWPVNHKMVTIKVSVSLEDASPATFTLVKVESNEPTNKLGDGSTSADILGWVTGTGDVAGQLRAERAGNLRDRIYTLTYRGTDERGNSADAACVVTVPHDKR